MKQNPVTIVFTDGTELDVEIVARLVGAEWMYAQVCVNSNKGEGGELERDEIILRSDEVRYIRCYNTIAPNASEANTRIHHGEDRDPETAAEQLIDLYKAQHQIHPNNDPSAFEESETQWPPTEAGGINTSDRPVRQ